MPASSASRKSLLPRTTPLSRTTPVPPMKTRLLLPLLLGGGLLAGCDPFGHLPDRSWFEIAGALWDADDTVAATDGVYVRLPHAGALARVRDNGAFDVVELDGAEPVRMTPTPEQDALLVGTRWQVCDDPDPKIERISDCDSEDLSWDYELVFVSEAGVTSKTNIPPHLNRVAFSPDGRIGVAYLDYDSSEDIPVEGVVDLSQVAFIDLATGEVTNVSVGFSADNVIFSLDGSRAVVMSRSKVVVVELETFEVTVQYPLTLDADQRVDPSSASLTPDGRYALITISGSSDLYKLDLDVEAIDIVSLDGVPAMLSVDEDLDLSVLVYAGDPVVEVMDHDYFELDSIELDEPCTSIIDGDGFALLYNDRSGTHDVYTLDLETRELHEYVMGNRVSSMQLTDSERYAVAVLAPDSSGGGGSDLEGYQDVRWGLGVIDLVDQQAIDLVVESQPTGLAVVETDEESYALITLAGDDDVLKLTLSDPAVPERIPMPAPAQAIGSLPDGRFYITHDATLGLISFFDPSDDSLTSAAGFAAYQLTDDDLLPRRDQYTTGGSSADGQ